MMLLLVLNIVANTSALQIYPSRYFGIYRLDHLHDLREL